MLKLFFVNFDVSAINYFVSRLKLQRFVLLILFLKICVIYVNSNSQNNVQREGFS
jgi:hypothetical protein